VSSRYGDGRITITYDSTASLCTTVVPGSGAVTAPTSGSADLAVAVTLSTASAVPVTVQWSTTFVPGAPANSFLGPQAATSDYTPSSGTVTFAPGVTSAVVHIPVTGATASPVEYLVVSFTGATNARIGGFYGLGFGIILAAG
jgi:chitinase